MILISSKVYKKNNNAQQACARLLKVGSGTGPCPGTE